MESLGRLNKWVNLLLLVVIALSLLQLNRQFSEFSQRSNQAFLLLSNTNKFSAQPKAQLPTQVKNENVSSVDYSMTEHQATQLDQAELQAISGNINKIRLLLQEMNSKLAKLNMNSISSESSIEALSARQENAVQEYSKENTDAYNSAVNALNTAKSGGDVKSITPISVFASQLTSSQLAEIRNQVEAGVRNGEISPETAIQLF